MLSLILFVAASALAGGLVAALVLCLCALLWVPPLRQLPRLIRGASFLAPMISGSGRPRSQPAGRLGMRYPWAAGGRGDTQTPPVLDGWLRSLTPGEARQMLQWLDSLNSAELRQSAATVLETGAIASLQTRTPSPATSPSPVLTTQEGAEWLARYFPSGSDASRTITPSGASPTGTASSLLSADSPSGDG